MRTYSFNFLVSKTLLIFLSKKQQNLSQRNYWLGSSFSIFTKKIIKILNMQGDIGDHESIIAALKQVDVVISAVGGRQVLDQLNLIKAIKEVGHIQVCPLISFHVVKCM